MSKSLFVACALVAFASTSACSSSSSPHGDDDPSTPPDATVAEDLAYDELYGALAAAYCDRVFACCLENERTLIGILPHGDDNPDLSTPQACTTHMTSWLRDQGRLSYLDAAVASGAVGYDPSTAGACVAQFEAMSCGDFGHQFAEVRSMAACSPFVPSLADGAACAYDEQCQSGLCTGEVCTAKPAAEGAPCPDQVCADGLYCGVFTDYTCKRPAALGEECHDGNLGCDSGYCSYLATEDGLSGYCAVEEDWVCDAENPPPVPGCTEPAPFPAKTFTAGEATIDYGYDFDQQRAIEYIGILDATTAVELSMWEGLGAFEGGFATGTYRFQDRPVTLDDCGLCTFVYTRYWEPWQAQVFMATSGTVRVDRIDRTSTGRIQATLTDVDLQKLVWDAGANAWVLDDGCAAHLDGVTIDVPLTPAPFFQD